MLNDTSETIFLISVHHHPFPKWHPYQHYHFQVTISVHIPADAIVGDYQAAVHLMYKDEDKVEKTKITKLADPIIILFNPFCEGNF